MNDSKVKKKKKGKQLPLTLSQLSMVPVSYGGTNVTANTGCSQCC